MSVQCINPIIPGFYPDPSICRVGDDYYMVNSTFAYFPGVPLMHSKNLVNWEQIGSVLDRESQLNLENAGHSHGIFAPTIRYHDGVFYMITTNISHGGNFIVTTTDPYKGWSEPHFIKGADGIDPSLFFDDDGRCYYCGTHDRRDGARYWGDNEIWVQELDISRFELVGESWAAWHGHAQNAIWAEGPHIFKRNGRYYLSIAEGGTGYNHAVTIARSNDIREPFEGYICNPILTHRHLGKDFPVTNVGHADIFEAHDGNWYIVILASRPCDGYSNLGRETFLARVEWENDWPVINPGKGMLEESFILENMPDDAPPSYDCDIGFDKPSLPPQLIFLRNPDMENYSLDIRRGWLALRLAPETITELKSPSCVLLRQRSMDFTAETRLDFIPRAENECAGLVLVQSNEYNYEFSIALASQGTVINVIRTKAGVRETIVSENINASSFALRIEQRGQSLSFSCSSGDDRFITVADNVDASMLSTEAAGGFVGTCVGLYASANGMESENRAFFKSFSLTGKGTDR